MWQFIPDTGKRFGLNIGPLARQSDVDQFDDRFNWEKATPAAARYIKDIYSTDAQASGLLVMASYNWGEVRVIDILKKMPQNPKDRNFWKLLAAHQVPLQTYEYVFYIVSAAVIGENPRLFGYSFRQSPGFPAAAERLPLVSHLVGSCDSWVMVRQLISRPSCTAYGWPSSSFIAPGSCIKTKPP